MLKKVPHKEFFELEKTLPASKKALQYLYDEALEEGETEILQALDKAISACDEMIQTGQMCPVNEDSALLGFYFIKAVLVLSPEEIRPLLLFLRWMSVVDKFH